jgi:peroxiredoxin-like protein
MADLSSLIKAKANGSGKDREGVIAVDGLEVRYSAPGPMGGKGVGASPETLLISAVTACYSLTLLAYLQKRRFPYREIEVKTEGIVTGFPLHDTYAKIIVNPMIRGASSAQRQEYQDAAAEARDHCFIGQTVAAGGVSYQLGTVTLE